MVTPQSWRETAAALAAGRATLLALWGDAGTTPMVHMAVIAETTGEIAVVSLPCPSKKFPSVGAVHAPAIRLERAIYSLYGYEPTDAPDARPWLDLGFWDVRHPLGDRTPAPTARASLCVLARGGRRAASNTRGPGACRHHRAGTFPFHLRRRNRGAARATARLCPQGHRVADGGRDASRKRHGWPRAPPATSTVAYGIAFAHAVEAALNVQAPPRARYLRALMAELERLANHFGDIGAICNDASFSLMHAQCGIVREQILRAAAACFGHRLMMDRVVPGGVAADLAPGGADIVRQCLRDIAVKFPRLIELYDNTASLQDRTVATGIVTAELAREFGAPGYVGRASGRGFDARKTPGYAPYDELEFTVPVLTAGDVNARIWIRIREVEQSLALIEQILARLPDGPLAVAAAAATDGEGLGLSESFRGDVLVWVRIEGARVARCHLRDPSWFQWPLLEAAIEGNIVADFPLCNKSFNCSYSGHDL